VSDLLVDSDVLVDHLRGARAFAPGAHDVAYSVVTRTELFAGHARQEEAVKLLLAPFAELPIDRSVAELAGRLRRDHGVRIADALIGATAITHRRSLLTRNVRAFANVPGLHLAERLR
jgi:predicted nucleic acid-binding protein